MTKVYQLISDAEDELATINVYNMEFGETTEMTIEQALNEYGYFNVSSVNFRDIPICINVKGID